MPDTPIDPWEVIAETLRDWVHMHARADAEAALTSLREQMEQDVRALEVMDAKLTQANGSIAALREQVERQEEALHRLASVKAFLVVKDATEDDEMMARIDYARAALSTGEPSDRCATCGAIHPDDEASSSEPCTDPWHREPSECPTCGAREREWVRLSDGGSIRAHGYCPDPWHREPSEPRVRITPSGEAVRLSGEPSE